MSLGDCCDEKIRKRHFAHGSVTPQLLMNVEHASPISILSREPLMAEAADISELVELRRRTCGPENFKLDDGACRYESGFDARRKEVRNWGEVESGEGTVVSEVPRYRSHTPDITSGSRRSG